MTSDRRPARAVATAPVRVADVGGWTDTWFGSPGQVCHLAVGPGVRVEAVLVEPGLLEPGPVPAPVAGPERPVRLIAPDLGEDYAIGPSADRGWAAPAPGRHPLLEHAVTSVLEAVDLPAGRTVTVTITSAVPAGASLGTSGAVVVALLAALDALFGRSRTPAELAVAAHQVESARAGRESGVQDQWAAALGGCGLLAIGPYPEVRHRAVPVATEVRAELGERLVTVVFGAHDSSAVHAEVIEAMVGCGGAGHDRARAALRDLAALAREAADALAAGSIAGWAEVLVAATAGQGRLHPALVGPAHRAAIDVAVGQGARGWKVNGAGGGGGSLTVVADDAAAADRLRAALAATDPGWRLVDLAPAPGLAVRTTAR